MKKTSSGLLCLCLFLSVLLVACGSESNARPLSSSNLTSDSLNQNHAPRSPTPMPPLSIPSQRAPTPTAQPRVSPVRTPAPNPTPAPTQPPASGCVTYSNETTLAPARNGTLAAPYGPAPVSAEAQQLAQQLIQLVNYDRAACGLPAFSWNATLASGALLHSWNMYRAGFSHYVPDGSAPCQRIANEGYPGARDCGENIGEAGGYPTAWGSVSSVQESMAHEPLGGWHRIHLFSTTLHSMGIGVYVAPNGTIWFTEDMVS